jgi:hypothetical protein
MTTTTTTTTTTLTSPAAKPVCPMCHRIVGPDQDVSRLCLDGSPKEIVVVDTLRVTASGRIVAASWLHPLCRLPLVRVL